MTEKRKALNKENLVLELKERTGFTLDASEKAVTALLALIKDEILDGGEVKLNGLGTLYTRVRAPYLANNPQNPGEKVEVPETIVPAFRAYDSLKDALNK